MTPPDLTTRVEGAGPDEQRELPPTLSLWVDHTRRSLYWNMDNGAVQLAFPSVMKPVEIDELEQLFALVIKGQRRKAEQTEAAILKAGDAG